MQYNEHQLAQLAAAIASGLAPEMKLLEQAGKDGTRTRARELAQVSLLVARHILAGAHMAGMKEDELELLYDDADFF